MGELSAWHWAVVLVVAVVLFGSRRLPDAARSIGRSARILKAELRGDDPAAANPPPARAETPAPSAIAEPAPAPVPEPAVEEERAPDRAPDRG